VSSTDIDCVGRFDPLYYGQSALCQTAALRRRRGAYESDDVTVGVRIKPDDLAAVVDPVDYGSCRPDRIGIVDFLEAHASDAVDESVSVAGGIDVGPDHLSAIIQAESLREDRPREIEGGEGAADIQEAVGGGAAGHVKTSDKARSVDVGCLGANLPRKRDWRKRAQNAK